MMRKIVWLLLLCLIAFAGLLLVRSNKLPNISTQQTAMKLTSPAFVEGQVIPDIYTCRGKNVSPPLIIDNVPANTVTLAIIFEDRDAPFQTWDHWIVWNIDPKNFMIIEGSLPVGSVQGINSFGKPGYGGPCPPTGSHRYTFKLFALDTAITLPPEAGKQDLEEVMQDHILGQTSLSGVFP